MANLSTVREPNVSIGHPGPASAEGQSALRTPQTLIIISRGSWGFLAAQRSATCARSRQARHTASVRSVEQSVRELLYGRRVYNGNGVEPKAERQDNMDDNRTGEQVSKVGNNAKSGIETAVGTITDVAEKAQTAAVEASGTMRDAALETAKQVGDAATKTYRQGVRAGEYVSQSTAEQPLLALLVAGAIGFGIAYMVYARK
jgi:hypothetical protein